jgi:2-dehydropantoate 2-reductase
VLATLAALREHGWRLGTSTGLVQAPAHTSEHARELGAQDLVVVAVKGPAMTEVARGIAPLLGPETIVLPAMNGVPWWFCEGIPGFPGGPLKSVDPGGEIAAAIPFRHVLGCVVHASAAVSEPGLAIHSVGERLIVGEPRKGTSERVRSVAELLAHARFEVTQSSDVRYDIWYKLWGNMTMNPVSALTGATVERVLGDPLVRDFCSAAMSEAAVVGNRIGCAIHQGPEDRHAVTARLGAFRTSMLQDVEAGRLIELDAIVGAVYEIGQRLGVAMPNIAALLGLTRLFARVHRLYPDETA